MTNALRISRAGALAMHAMALLAEREEAATTEEIAKTFRVSQAHLSKVMQRLARRGLVKSTSGRRGGFRLGKRPEEITLLEIYEAIDGSLSPTNCLLTTPLCGGKHCILGGLLRRVNREVAGYLTKTRLSSLKAARLRRRWHAGK